MHSVDGYPSPIVDALVADAAARQAARYRPMEFPDWGDPWAFPAALWRLPYWPVRLYLKVGDALLFRLWEASRPLVWSLEDLVGGAGSRFGAIGNDVCDLHATAFRNCGWMHR